MAAGGPLAGFVYSLPTQNTSALCSSRCAPRGRGPPPAGPAAARRNLVLPSCSRRALSVAPRFAGPYEFKAPVELTAETENAFKLLTLKAPPQQTQPLQPRRQPAAAGAAAQAPPQQPQQHLAGPAIR